MTKPPVPLGRAPRPRASAEQIAEIQADTAGLGFNRPSSGSAAPEPKAEPQAEPKPPAPAPVPAADEWPDSIRFPVTSELYEELRAAAYSRRVTVRYLCLEALAKAGFKVDLENLPVDGRRIKKRNK